MTNVNFNICQVVAPQCIKWFEARDLVVYVPYNKLLLLYYDKVYCIVQHVM